MINPGIKAPNFTLLNANREKISLADFKGKTVVLYFYPKDNTPGCTKEACDFRDNFGRITQTGAVVIGISADSVESHEKFQLKYDLPFELLSDEKHKVLEAYGVWKEKSMYGKKFIGIERTTYIIDKEGKVLQIFPKVKVKGHIDEILRAIESQ